MKGKPFSKEVEEREINAWLAGASGISRLSFLMNCAVHPSLSLQYEECILWGTDLNEDNRLLCRPKAKMGREFQRETYIQSYQAYKCGKKVLRQMDSSLLAHLFYKRKDNELARIEAGENGDRSIKVETE